MSLRSGTAGEAIFNRSPGRILDSEITQIRGTRLAMT